MNRLKTDRSTKAQKTPVLTAAGTIQRGDIMDLDCTGAGGNYKRSTFKSYTQSTKPVNILQAYELNCDRNFKTLVYYSVLTVVDKRIQLQ